MSTRTIDTNKLVNGYVSQGWYNGRKATTVRQRCNLTYGSYFALNYTLPARSRIVWAEMLVNSTVTAGTVTGGPAAAAAAGVGLFVFPPAATASTPITTPPNTATQAFTSFSGGTSGYLVSTTPDFTTAVTSQVRGIPQVYATNASNIPHNPQTAGAMIALMPISTAATGLIAYPAATGY
jgi:hypothetical protein